MEDLKDVPLEEMKIVSHKNEGIKDRNFYTIKCTQGHQFDVEDRFKGASFVTCPECGEKKCSLGGMIFRYKKNNKIKQL